ncbi:MAG: CDP-glycerol glycerophosphotransferase family protein [Patescibacteria group bacterium]
MKRKILITCFHPIISRNILSTDIIPILLSSGHEMKITIVVEEHKKEFFKKRFEKGMVSVVSIPRVHTKSGLFFKRLSRSMLDTETTRLRAKTKLIREKKHLYYTTAVFLFWLGHFKAVRSFLRTADQQFNSRRHIQKIFKEVRPDMIFSTDTQLEQDVVFIEEAKARNISVFGKVRSWDNLSQWGFLRSLPDKLIVQSEELKREAILWHDMPEKDIAVTGVPHYDKYIDPVLKKKGDLLKEFDLDETKPLIFYAPLADFRIPNNDADQYILEILSALDANIWVRFPPNDDVTIGDFKPPKNMIFDRPGKETGSGRAIDRDMAEEDDEKLRTVLSLCDVVVCGPSSIAIDAAVFDKPIIMVNFSKTERTYWDGVVEYDFTHISKLLSVGGVRVVKSKNDLILWIEKYLKDPSLDKEGRERLRTLECYKIDGQSSQRTVNFLLSEMI